MIAPLRICRSSCIDLLIVLERRFQPIGEFTEILGCLYADSSLFAIVAIEETNRLAWPIQIEPADRLSVVVIEQDSAVGLDVTQRQSFGIDDRVKDGFDRIEAFALFVCSDNS